MKTIKSIALIIIVFAAFCCIAELFAAIFFLTYPPITAFIKTNRSGFDRTALHSCKTLAQTHAIEREHRAANKNIYSPWIEFRVRDFHGTYVNVSGPIRASVPDRNKPGQAKKIFFFGGSTMFGYNVADDETIVSCFVKELQCRQLFQAVQVYNYGQPYYYSFHEAQALQTMLLSGVRPDMVIFLDGLNDCIQPGATYHREPFFTSQLRTLWNLAAQHNAIGALLFHSNAMQLIGIIAGMLSGRNAYAAYDLPGRMSADSIWSTVYTSYCSTVEYTHQLCQNMNIDCMFFWQPVPFYNYDRSSDPLCSKRDFPQFAKLYPQIKDYSRALLRVVFLGDLLVTADSLPFVDGFHYSASFNRTIAAAMVDSLLQRKLLQ